MRKLVGREKDRKIAPWFLPQQIILDVENQCVADLK